MLASYDDNGNVLDFGALEIQAVYISGNIRRPFEKYIKSPKAKQFMDWNNESNYPRPDYLSSSRKRLLPQLVYKGRILQAWKKKIAVAIHSSFYNTLPELPQIEKDDAEINWLIYDLCHDDTMNNFQLTLQQSIYTYFDLALNKITTSNAGPIEDFIQQLQEKLDEQLESHPPDAPTLLQNQEE